MSPVSKATRTTGTRLPAQKLCPDFHEKERRYLNTDKRYECSWVMHKSI